MYRWLLVGRIPWMISGLRPGLRVVTMMSMTIRRLALTLAAPIAILLALACGSGGKTGTTSEPGISSGEPTAATPTATSAAPVATVPAGQPLVVTRDVFGTMTVVEVTVSDVKAGVKGDQFTKPQRGQFVTAKVAVLAKEGKYQASPYSFKLVGPDGSVFDSSLLSVARPDLPSSELSAGQRTSGYVTFDAAVGAEKGGRIALKDWLAEGDAGYWKL
jgi:uncharacterized protein DUF4352